MWLALHTEAMCVSHEAMNLSRKARLPVVSAAAAATAYYPFTLVARRAACYVASDCASIPYKAVLQY